MNPKAILVGNGINYDSGAPGWRDVVGKLGASAGLSFSSEDFDHVPFSLLSDQVFCRSGCVWQKYRDGLIAELAQLVPSKAHRALATCGVPEILTTNYDLTIEKAFGIGVEGLANCGWSTESKYSQFRHFEIPSGPRVWHIHGDASVPGSILLGYERYLGYAQVIRQTLTEGREYRKQRIGPWRKLVEAGDVDLWPRLFLNSDLLIVGLALDFAETHLWWLLSYRAAKRNDPGTKGFPRNRIAFVWNRSMETTPRALAMVRQLKAFDVEIVERNWIPKKWNAGYARVIRDYGRGRL